MDVKFYTIFVSVIFAVIAIIINFLYIIKSEKIKENLIKETQFQQITIDTLTKNANKQLLIINEYEKLLKKQKKDAQKLSQQEQKALASTAEANDIFAKQTMLNVLFEQL